MAGIGDSWGTREELLHPRGPDGRWIRKAGIAKKIFGAVLGFLANFRPRSFQNRNQSTQYLHNISRRQGRGRMTNGDLRRLYDLPNVNEDLQDGDIDNPSTQQFVSMMDRTQTELPDDLILTTIVPTESFGYSTQTATGTNSDTDPGIRELSGRLVADRGYVTAAIGNVDDAVPVPVGSVRLIVAAKKGTKVNIPGGSASDPTLFLTRGQPLRITKIKPDGAGGWHMYATTGEARTRGEVPTPIGGPRGLQRPPTGEREAAIRDLGRIQAAREKRPDDVAEQQDEAARAARAAEAAQVTPTPSPQQETERRRLEAQQVPQQPAPGEPPPRTERPVGTVGGAPAAGGVQPQTPAPTVPEAPTAPRRSVDLRLAARDAGLGAPSAGSRRRLFNEHYLGVASGKKDPIDAVRELDRDIEVLRGGGEPGGAIRGGTDEDREKDAAVFEQLRDLIAKEYGLPESPKRDTTPRTQAGLPKIERPEKVKTKLSRREQEAEARNRAAAEAEAPPAPTPVKAPAKKAAKKAVPSAPEAPGDPLDKMSKEELLAEADRRGLTARKSYTKDRIKRVIQEGPELEAARRARMPSKGTSAPAKKAVPSAPQAPGDDLDKMTKQELLDEAKRRDVEVPKSWTKDKIKAALRDESFRRPEKKTPTKRAEVRRSQQALQEEFKQREAAGEGAPAPVKKAAKKAAPRKLNSRNLNPGDRVIWEVPGEVPVHGVVEQQGTRTFVNWEGGRRERVTSTGDGGMGPDVRLATPEEIEEHGTLGPPMEEPRAPAAKAAVPGAAPGTAAGKITAGRIQPGMRVLVTQNNNGDWVPSTRKTGQTTITVDRFDRVAGRGGRARLAMVGRDDDGNEIKLLSAPAHQTFIVAPEPGAPPAKKAAKAAKKAAKAAKKAAPSAPEAPDREQAARDRQARIDLASHYGRLGAEIEELIDNESDPDVLTRGILRVGRGLPPEELDQLVQAASAGNFNDVRNRMGLLLQAQGVNLFDRPNTIELFDRRRHELLGEDLPEGARVHVVRPGIETTIDGEHLWLRKAVVEAATPEEVARDDRGKKLVPEGSVPGARTDTPVDNAPRKRELRQAWIAADIQPPSGPVRTQTEEIRDRLLNGDITPEESIRMMESEISFNKEDLAELDAHLRDADLTDKERKEFQDRAVRLTEGIREQEKAAVFLKMYFKEESPVVSLKEMKEVDPEGFEFLKDATPDDMREAAKEAGLDAPSGDTPDEMFRDLIKQVAKKELERRAAKKAAKKAPAKAAKKVAPTPAVPKEKERIDAKLVGAGIDFDENDPWVKRVLDDVQKDLDAGDKTPAAIGRELDESATRRMTTAVYEHGAWHAESSLLTDEERAERKAENQREYDRVKAETTKIRELGKRLEATRRKPVKKAAPEAPKEIRTRDQQIDDLQKRIIDNALKELSEAKTRDKGDDALEGLTLQDLGRLADSMGVPRVRTKRGMRDAILDRFVPRPKVFADDLYDLPSRDAGREVLAPLNKAELMAIAEEINLPRYKSMSMERLRQEILEGTTGARLDSIATRGFTGPRPDMPDAPRTKSLSARARAAGIDSPGELFSDVDSAITEADRRLQMGDWSPNEAAKFLRERAAQVAKADIMEEGRRFRTEKDKDSLLSIRKQSAEYLRRVATHVQQEAKERRAAKKAPAKKAAPRPDLGEQVKILARGTTRAEREGTDLPSPSRTGTSPVAPPRPTGLSPHPPVSGDRSTAPEIPNNWGMLGTGGAVEFHPDGVIGNGLRDMGDDRLMDVDGEPLSNLAGKLATMAIRGQISQEQLLDELRRLEQRLPEGSRARRGVASMIRGIDAPERAMPDLPQGTLPPFRKALQGLLRNPLTRGAIDRPGFHRDSSDSEVDKVLKLLEEFQEGRTGGLQLSVRVRQMRTSLPHESQEGRFEADRILRELQEELENLYKNPETRPQLTPREQGTRTPKKTTPRLTAIPGGGTGRGKGKRPNLRVVRNEDGEFTLVWDEGGDDHVQLPGRERSPNDLYAGSTV